MFGDAGTGKSVNQKLISRLWFTYRTDSITCAARGTILSQLSRDSLSFTRGNTKVKLSRAFQLVLQTSWKRFIEAAFDQALTTGVVVWYIEKHATHTGIPVAADPSTFNLEIHRDGCKMRTTAVPTDPGTKVKLNVWSGFGWDFTAEGCPTSPMISILPLVETMRSMIDTGLRGDALSANPTIVCQHKQRVGNSATAEEFDMFAEVC